MAAAAATAMSICGPAGYLRGDREYEPAMAVQMLRRAIGKAAARCA